MNNMNMEELVQLRTKMILEGRDVTDINFLIDSKEEEYLDHIFEGTSGTGGPSGAAGSATTGMGGGGVAYGTAAVSGMGAVISPQPSSNAGQTISPGYEQGGGKTGSGDIGVPYNTGGTKVFQKVPVDNRRGNSKRRKNKMLAGLKGMFAKRQDFTAGQGEQPKSPKIMNFQNFKKDDLMKIKKVSQ